MTGDAGRRHAEYFRLAEQVTGIDTATLLKASRVEYETPRCTHPQPASATTTSSPISSGSDSLSSSAERLMCADAFGRGRSEASSRDNSGCVAEASRPVRADSEASLTLGTVLTPDVAYVCDS